MLPESTVCARADAVSIEHRISHFPKHPLCDICNRAKLFSKRVKSHRVQDPDADLPETSKAWRADFLVVHDSFSGILNAYPATATTKSSDFVYSCLGHFVGLRFKHPDAVCRSDAAPQLIKAIHELGWLPETPLRRGWPHNVKCERMIRTFEECCRCLCLQAGFAMVPKLLTVACRYAAVGISMDKWKTAIGTNFIGARYARGQLVFYRAKSQCKPKLDPNASPALENGIWPQVQRSFDRAWLCCPS